MSSQTQGNYKEVTICLIGDSHCGKSTSIKAYEAIYSMDMMGVPKQEQLNFFKNSNLALELGKVGLNLSHVLDAFCIRNENGINFDKLQDFINIPKIKNGIQKDSKLKSYYSSQGVRDFVDMSMGKDFDGESKKILNDFYEAFVNNLEPILVETRLTLSDMVMKTTTTITYSFKEMIESKKNVNWDDVVWVDIGGEYVKTTLRDVGGQVKFCHLRPRLYNNVDGVVIFVDLLSSQTLKNVGRIPDSVTLPKYEDLDGANLALTLKILNRFYRDDYELLTSEIPQLKNENVVRNLAKADIKDPLIRDKVNIVLKKGIPKKLYKSLYKKYQANDNPGWLQEMYNSRWVMKKNENDIVMVPVLIYANKTDRMDMASINDMDIRIEINKIGRGRENLPYIKGSSKELDNTRELFQFATLLALSASNQISPEDYQRKMEVVKANIRGIYSLAGWDGKEIATI
jgi:GTPase SAR1 family protein